MSIFSKSERKLNEAIANLPQEEWIWIEGVKGMNKDMTCRGYQFKLGRQENMPDGVEIRDCYSGFHLCLNLKDVFEYYNIGKGNRFFRVKALVRKKDFDEYVDPNPTRNPHTLISWRRDKLAAKSIIPLYELTPEQIFAGTKEENWSLEDKIFALENGKTAVYDRINIRELIELGYSESFAYHIVTRTHKFEIAKAVGSQTDLSMDMKVLCILSNKLDEANSLKNMFVTIQHSASAMSSDIYNRAMAAAAIPTGVLQSSLYKLAED